MMLQVALKEEITAHLERDYYERTTSDRKGATGLSVKELYAKIGQLTMENDFLSVALGRIAEPSAKI